MTDTLVMQPPFANVDYLQSLSSWVSTRSGLIAVMKDGDSQNFSLIRISDGMLITRWGASGNPTSTGAIAEADRRIAAGQV